MGKSTIGWCDQTRNDIVTGCSPASPGCGNCWAARNCGQRQKHQPCLVGAESENDAPAQGVKADLVEPGNGELGDRPVYNGRVAFDPERLATALKMPKNGGRAYPRTEDGACDFTGGLQPKGNRIFWNSTSDPFHERISFEEIGAQYAVFAWRDDLRPLLLTKRIEQALRFYEWVRDHRDDPVTLLRSCFKAVMGEAAMVSLRKQPMLHVWPPPNVALGVSVENQRWWDRRVPTLEKIPAAYKFVSLEPMLGPVVATTEQLARLDQVIVGAESGPGARPMALRWAQDIGRQVLGAARLEIECLDPDLVIETGTVVNRGPHLFIKQADVCALCAGSGVWWPDGEVETCIECGDRPDMPGHGRAGKVRKHCPELWIPGYGTQSHQGHFWSAP